MTREWVRQLLRTTQPYTVVLVIAGLLATVVCLYLRRLEYTKSHAVTDYSEYWTVPHSTNVVAEFLQLYNRARQNERSLDEGDVMRLCLTGNKCFIAQRHREMLSLGEECQATNLRATVAQEATKCRSQTIGGCALYAAGCNASEITGSLTNFLVSSGLHNAIELNDGWSLSTHAVVLLSLAILAGKGDEVAEDFLVKRTIRNGWKDVTYATNEIERLRMCTFLAGTTREVLCFCPTDRAIRALQELDRPQEAIDKTAPMFSLLAMQRFRNSKVSLADYQSDILEKGLADSRFITDEDRRLMDDYGKRKAAELKAEYDERKKAQGKRGQ